MKGRTVYRPLSALLLAVAVPGAIAGQDVDAEGWQPEPVDPHAATIDLEARGGLALPVGSLKEFADPGALVGAGAALWLNDHVAVRLDGDAEILGGKSTEALPDTPDMRLYHYGAGLEFDVVGRAATEVWSLETTVGAGGTVLDTDPFVETDENRMEDVTRTFPNVNAGFAVGRTVAEDVKVSLGSRLFYTFLDDDDLDLLSRLRTNETLDDGISLPITFTVRWDLPRIG